MYTRQKKKNKKTNETAIFAEADQFFKLFVRNLCYAR